MKQKLGLLFLHYIRILAKLQLAKTKPDVIGITGSAGKSSVRNAVTRVLETKYKCKTTGKANSESGIPLDILGLEMKDYSMKDWLRVLIQAPIQLIMNWEKYDKYIIEMGVDSPDEPKNMGYLLKIMQPRTGIFVNAEAVHSEPFDKLVESEDPEQRKHEIVKLIAEEKGRMITGLPNNGVAILNMEDENIRTFTNRTKAEKVIGVGYEVGDIQVKNTKYNVNGFSCDFEYHGPETAEAAVPSQHLEFRNQILGPQYGITLALAIAAGMSHGIAFDDCVDALRLYRLPPGRMSLIAGINGSHIIDSSYNASTKPMLYALEVLEKAKAQAKRIAVLGDMRELGKEAKHEHEVVAEYASNIVDEFVLVGPLMKEFFLPKILSLGFDKEKVHWFENSAQAAEFTKGLIKGGEIILVKGSQNTIFLERVVEAIMSNSEMADELLCRRGEYWDKVRAKYS